MENPVDFIQVKSAQYIGDFAIRVTLSNGIKKLIDFKEFLENSLHPSIRKYLEESRFKEFQIVDGNLNWNDHDLIFPVDDLYSGKI